MPVPIKVGFAILVALVAPAHAGTAYTCHFDGGKVIIGPADEDTGRTTVWVQGATHQYFLAENKLIATEDRLPSYFFQEEFSRWKRLNKKGETIETAVCKQGTMTSLLAD